MTFLPSFGWLSHERRVARGAARVRVGHPVILRWRGHGPPVSRKAAVRLGVVTRRDAGAVVVRLLPWTGTPPFRRGLRTTHRRLPAFLLSTPERTGGRAEDPACDRVELAPGRVSGNWLSPTGMWALDLCVGTDDPQELARCLALLSVRTARCRSPAAVPLLRQSQRRLAEFLLVRA